MSMTEKIEQAQRILPVLACPTQRKSEIPAGQHIHSNHCRKVQGATCSQVGAFYGCSYPLCSILHGKKKSIRAHAQHAVRCSDKPSDSAPKSLLPSQLYEQSDPATYSLLPRVWNLPPELVVRAAAPESLAAGCDWVVSASQHFAMCLWICCPARCSAGCQVSRIRHRTQSLSYRCHQPRHWPSGQQSSE